MNSKTKTVLITGTTSGIGKAMAEEFARHGHDLVLVSRDAGKLSQQAQALQKFGVKLTIIALDLAEPDAAVSLAKRLEQEAIIIDILVHNAGFYSVGYFTDTDLEAELSMIQLHIAFITHFTKLILRQMIERDSGRILLLGSIASYIPGPLNAVYCASKAYILRFGEGLMEELRGTGVSVTVVCPGPVATEFARKVKFDQSKLFSENLLSAEQVAKSGYQAVMKRKRVIMVGFSNQLQMLLAKLFPSSVVGRIVKWKMKA